MDNFNRPLDTNDAGPDAVDRGWLVLTNFIGLVVSMIAGILTIFLPDKSTGLFAKFPGLYAPPSFTIAIWLLIFVLMCLFLLYQLRPEVRNDPVKGAFLDRIGLLFLIVCLANAAWTLAWRYDAIVLSLVFIMLQLVVLTALYRRLGIGLTPVSSNEKYLVHVPFSVYLGWIAVAAIALLTMSLDGFDLNRQFWGVLIITIGIIMVLLMFMEHRDVFFALVVDWALLGLLLKRLQESTLPDEYVVGTCIAGLIVITGGIIVQVIRRRVYYVPRGKT